MKAPDSLNICLIAPLFPILGRAASNGFLWPVARQMAELGHNVTVLSWKSLDGVKELEIDGVRVFYLGEYPFRSRSQFTDYCYQKFLELHQKQAFHIVHSIDSSGSTIASQKQDHNVCVTFDVSATQLAQIFSILGRGQDTLGSYLQTSFAVLYKFMSTYYGQDRKLLKSSDGILVTSPYQRIVLERYYLYPEYRTYIVPYGIELTDLNTTIDNQKLKESLGLTERSQTIVTLSDMTETTEIFHLLRAFEQVAIKKPHTRLIIVGHGPLRKQIEFEVLSLALGNKVIFTSAVANKDIPEYISLADVFVNLSIRSTGFEPSILEAMAQRKIIIGSEVSPISTIVDDGVDGFLIRPADRVTLSNLLLDIFSEKLQVADIGEAARSKVLKIFDTERMAKRTLSAFYKTLKKSKKFKSLPQNIGKSRPNSSPPQANP